MADVAAIKSTFAGDFAKLLNAFVRTGDIGHLAAIYRAAAKSGEIVPPLAETLAAFDDDAIVTGLAQAEVAKQESAAPWEWTARVFAVEIERRLHERRKARGNDDAPIEIPHKLVEVKLEPQYGPYTIDVEQARPAVESLPDEVRSKLLIVTPAHTIPERVIPAEDVPETVRAGPVASWKAAISRYAESAAGKVLAASLKRDRLADRVTIRPRKRGGSL